MKISLSLRARYLKLVRLLTVITTSFNPMRFKREKGLVPSFTLKLLWCFPPLIPSSTLGIPWRKSNPLRKRCCTAACKPTPKFIFVFVLENLPRRSWSLKWHWEGFKWTIVVKRVMLDLYKKSFVIPKSLSTLK